MSGSILGKLNTPTISVASGVWGLREQMRARRDDVWPREITFAFNSATPLYEVTAADVSSITIPAGASAGQLAILFCSEDGASTQSLTSGWTVIAAGVNDVNTGGANNADVTAAYKILESGDPGSSLSCYGASDSTWYLAVFDSFINSVTIAGFQSQTTTGTASNQTIAASGGSAPLLIVAYKVAAQDTAATINGMTEDYGADSATSSPNPAQRVEFKYYASSPSNETVTTIDDAFGQLFASWYMELS